jgi:hypothetical protein
MLSIGSLDQPWPFIFIGWGGLAPQENPFTSLNLPGLLVLVGHGGTGQTGPVRPCRSCISHISLIWTPIWTFHIWILIYSTRTIQWWSQNCILWSLKTVVWPVRQDVPILGANNKLRQTGLLSNKRALQTKSSPRWASQVCGLTHYEPPLLNEITHFCQWFIFRTPFLCHPFVYSRLVPPSPSTEQRETRPRPHLWPFRSSASRPTNVRLRAS